MAGVALCCVLAAASACSLFVAPAAVVIDAIDGDGSARAVVGDTAGGTGAAHRVRAALVVRGAGLDTVTAARLEGQGDADDFDLDSSDLSLSAEEPPVLTLRLPDALRPAAYVLVLVGVTTARADVTFLQGEPGPAGPAGAVGAAGPAGSDGRTPVVVTAPLAVGDDDCPLGGLGVQIGVDANDDGDLDATEAPPRKICAVPPAGDAIACANGVCTSTLPLVAAAGLTVTGGATVDAVIADSVSAAAVTVDDSVTVGGTVTADAVTAVDVTADTVAVDTVTVDGNVSAASVVAASITASTVLRQGVRLVPGLVTTTEVIEVTDETSLRAAILSANNTRISNSGTLEIELQNDIALTGTPLTAAHVDGTRVRLRGRTADVRLIGPRGVSAVFVPGALRLADLTIESAGGEGAGVFVDTVVMRSSRAV